MIEQQSNGGYDEYMIQRQEAREVYRTAAERVLVGQTKTKPMEPNQLSRPKHQSQATQGPGAHVNWCHGDHISNIPEMRDMLQDKPDFFSYKIPRK